MGRKNGKKQTIRKTVDTLAKTMPKMRMRGLLNENSCTLRGNEFLNPATVTATNTVGYGYNMLAAGIDTLMDSSPITAIGKGFQFCLYLPGTTMTYHPACGLNQIGSIVMGYIDSPQVMRNWFNLSPGSHLQFLRQLPNSKSGPLWQELTVPIHTGKPRRSKFQNDPVVPNDTNELDLAAQGLFVWCIFNVSPAPTANTTYGQLIQHTNVRYLEAKSGVTA